MNAVRPATPLTPALSQWLRQSFAYTPEPTSESKKLHASHHDVHSQCLTEPRRSCDTFMAGTQDIVSRLRPSTKRKRANSSSMVVSEDVLPKAKKPRRKNAGDAAHSKVMSECKERHSRLVRNPRPVPLEKPSAAATPSRPRCQTEQPRRRMVLDAVEIVKRNCAKRSSDVKGVLEEGKTEVWNPNLEPRSHVGDNTTSTFSRKRKHSSPSPSTLTSKPSAAKRRRKSARQSSPAQNEEAHFTPRVSRCKSAPPLAITNTPLRISKYFDSASVQVTPPAVAGRDLLTDPKPITLTTRLASTKSSRTVGSPVGMAYNSTSAKWSPASGSYIASQEKYEALYADFMIMLGKLKPILVQESIRDDPWKVLLAVRMLNVTTGRAAIPIFWKIVNQWPTPRELVDAPLDELVELLRPLGLYNKRANWFKEISQLYMDDPPRYPSGHLQCPEAEVTTASQRPCIRRTRSRAHMSSPYPCTPISHFPGVGPYALDSFRIFCRSSLEPEAGTTNEVWKQVMPSDKELIRYLKWKWAYEERKIWHPDGIGVVGDVNFPYLITLVDELAEHYDTTIGGEGYISRFIDHVSGLD